MWHARRAGVSVRTVSRYFDSKQELLDDVADVIVTMLASSAFLELHTRLDRSPEDAARLATWAVTAMQKQFKHDGGMQHGASNQRRNENSANG